MKDFIELKMTEAKAQLDSAKIRFAAARNVNDDYNSRLEKDNMNFWEGYLSAFEDMKEKVEQ